MTRKRTYTFPDHIIDRIEVEAERRLREQNKIGKKMLGAVARDIICLLIVYTLTEIRDMTKGHYEAEVKRIKSKRGSG